MLPKNNIFNVLYGVFQFVWLASIVVFFLFFILFSQNKPNSPEYSQNAGIWAISIGLGAISYILYLVFRTLSTKDKKKILSDAIRQGFIATAVCVVGWGALAFSMNVLGYTYEKRHSQARVVAPSVTPSPTPRPTVSNQTVLNKQPLPVLNGADIFNSVNTYRAQNGHPFLSVSDELCKIAESRANYMMTNNMSAFKTSGLGAHTGFRNVQYSGNGVGENLAGNVVSTADVMAMWKNSPPHNELMLWTIKDGTPITKGCVATRVSEIGSIVVLEVGDK